MADEPATDEIDLRYPADSLYAGAPPSINPIDQHSPAWLQLVTPFANKVFRILFALIFLPMLALYCIPGMQSEERAKSIMSWATTVFPPIVGFGSAIVGYLFGTRSNQGNGNGK